MSRVTIAVDGSQARVYSPFDRERVNIIKSLPVRRWNADRKFWEIPSDLVGVLERRLTEFGDTVNVEIAPTDNTKIRQLQQEVRTLRQQLHQTRAASSAQTASWAELLLDQCTPELRANVFKALTRVLHPDVGGSTTLQRDLNLARERSRV